MPTFSIAGMMHQLSYDPNNPLLFNDGFFVYFFALFMAVYYAFRNKIHGRSIVVSLFSLYFFYKASGSFVLLVLFSAVANYWLSNQISKTSTGSRKKGLLATSVAVNLGMLFYFKYTNFFIGVLNDVGGGHIGLLHILLPVGISFFTFENLSYTIDVYRGEFEPEKKWWKKRKENEFAWKVSIEDIKTRNYNLDIKNPHAPEVENDDPDELLKQYHELVNDLQKTRDALKQELIQSLERRN